MKLKLFVDRLSQPCRAILIFCKMNKIEFVEVRIELSKGEQLSPEFKEINPMQKVPAMKVDERFRLFESHAILRFLAGAFPGVADHWYPADLFKRAEIDSVLDWHHANLRHGSAGLVFHSKLARLSGRPLDLRAAADCEKVLSASLAKIESVWLKEEGQFLLGNSKPSIADLSLVCETMQLEALDEKDRKRLLDPHEKVRKWMDDTRNAMQPYFGEIHGVLFQLKDKLKEMESDE
ncbi:glutathione S-transferase T1-like [Coffea eugenioides]|uniref:glutathione S-transferase T1-like n=1 Tax=Coffea eugenioides TaxID=49369 RepID=UPI000F609E8D|nr:glutathione S-transferase T1-like [Coffea eugenioides]